jgi:hypothetical protein
MTREPAVFRWFWRLFWIVAIAAVAAVVTATLAGAAEPDCAARPSWCQAGYVCVPTSCAASAAASLELLSAETEALRKKRIRKWACTLGPGAGVTLQANAGDVDFDAAPIVGAVVCGWTF